MKEGTPRTIKDTAAWAIDRIAAQMEQDPVALRKDTVTGFGFTATDPEHTHDRRYAALFPDERVVRIGAPDLDIRIRNASVRPAADGMEVRAGDGSVRALFLRDGHIAVEVFPIPALAVTEAALRDEDPSDTQIRDAIMGDVSRASSREIRVSDDVFLPLPSAPSDGISGGTGGGSEFPAAMGSPETEANPDRVKNLRGGVATKPNMEPTPQGKPRVQFVLAEHQEHEGEEQTVFHRVYTLNKQAESLQRRGLEKGQLVGVDGYRQQRTTKKKDGSAVEHAVIYANVVRTFGKRERVDADEAHPEPK